VLKKHLIAPVVLFVLLIPVLGPISFSGYSQPVDVADGTLFDWVDAPVKLYDVQGDSPNDMTDLAFVSFDFDDTWLYVRWDIFDNTSYSPQVLYDMGINLSANGIIWDVYVSAEMDLVGGLPEVVNISIRDATDNHIWNASDDGNMTEDGSVYLDPTPGLPPGNMSVEARFPLSYIGIVTGVVFGQFRSHPSTSVNSVVKDTVPDSGYIILVIDNNPPQLNNLADSPDPQENGLTMNITVDATDDFGIGSVWVNITYPDSSYTNLTMLNGSGDEWYLEDIFNDLGTYTYSVWANDTSDNWINIGPGTFTIQDTDGPFFDNLQDSPDPQENGDYVNVSVDVTDDFAVDSVWIEILYPNGTTINVSMNKGLFESWYFDAQYHELGLYQYTIWANDSNDNWNFTGPETFTIQDTEPPTIQDPVDSPDPQDMGGNVNITVIVIDDVDVEEVKIEIRYPDGTWINITMDPGATDEWFINMTFDDPGVYVYIIYANDTSGNTNYTSLHDFTISDTEGPQIDDPHATPNPQEKDGFVNITVNITDNDEIDEVWINITFPNGTWINDTMKKGSGDEWYYNATFPDIGNYTYTIWAVDESGNSRSSDPNIFTIESTDTPQPGPPPTPSPPLGIPKKLYLVTILIFWPLLLMIFTLVLEHKYGFGNRFKSDIKPAVSALLDGSKSNLSNPNKLHDLFVTSQSLGIPMEEVIVSALTANVPPKVQNHLINDIMENIDEIKGL
jgi:hypothetical protein